MTQFSWLALYHCLIFFPANSTDLVYMVHSTWLWSPLLQPPPHSFLSCPPSFVQPTPVRPHRPFKEDLGNLTELYFRKINLASMYRADWRQWASWEGSAKFKGLNLDWTENGKEINNTWEWGYRLRGLGLQGHHLRLLMSWVKGLSKEYKKNFSEKKNCSRIQKVG